LFCFPYAGGNAPVFRTWPAGLPRSVEVCAARLPGRDERWREPPFTRLGPLVEALAGALRPYLGKPFAFFGHSMGALVGYELIRRLRREGGPTPLHYFASGRRAPHVPREEAPLHTMPEEQFREELRRIGGTPREVLEHEELMRVVSPTLRADFAVIETYAYAPEEALVCPITALGGVDDNEVSREGLEAWRQHTRGAFRVRMLPGDHFFLRSAQAQILGILREELAPLAGDPAAGWAGF
jgi:medium-chain acyl-[acyl-carrier-protein] hydrolase